MKKYVRECPHCHNTIKYKTYKVFWKARKHNSNFENIGNPLKKFIRVSSDNNGKVIEEKVVYKGGN